MKNLVKFGGLAALLALAVTPAFANRVDGGTSNSGVTTPGTPIDVTVTAVGSSTSTTLGIDALTWENTPGLTVYELQDYQNYSSITFDDPTFDATDSYGSFVCELDDVAGAGNTDSCDGEVSAPTVLDGSGTTFTIPTGATNGNAGTADATTWFFYDCSGSSASTCDADVEAALVTTTPTPEPESFSLLGLGLVGVGFAVWRRRVSVEGAI